VKLFSAKQIKEWDAFTIKNEPVSSLDLMERAAKVCASWIQKNFIQSTTFKIFCGKGNNGGDGLAIARLLKESNYAVLVYIIDSETAGSEDFQANLERLQALLPEIYFIKTEQSFPAIEKGEVIIDALFGTGLNKKLSGIFQQLIYYVNNSGAQAISVDMPSGLYADKSSAKNAIMRARYTLTFQQPKIAFLLAENEAYCGKVIVLDLGLSAKYSDGEKTAFELTEKKPGRTNIYSPQSFCQ